jgi:hypothetical protein
MFKCNNIYAFDIKADCSDLAQIQKSWDEKYYYDFKFGPKGSKPPKLECDSPYYRAAKVLWVLENAKSADGYNYYKKIKRLTAPYDVGKNCSELSTLSCPHADLLFNPEDPEFNYKFNLIFRLGHLIHEAWHFERKMLGNHVLCKYSDNDYSCDPKFIGDRNFANTFSYEIIYLKNIVDNNNFDEGTTAAIKAYAYFILNNKFNEIPSSK